MRRNETESTKLASRGSDYNNRDDMGVARETKKGLGEIYKLDSYATEKERKDLEVLLGGTQ
jgi:hypothetical protein